MAPPVPTASHSRTLIDVDFAVVAQVPLLTDAVVEVSSVHAPPPPTASHSVAVVQPDLAVYARKAWLTGAGFPVYASSMRCTDDSKAVVGSCLTVCTSVFPAAIACVAVDTIGAIPVAATGNAEAIVDVFFTPRTCETRGAWRRCWFDCCNVVALCGGGDVSDAVLSTEP